MEKNLTIKEKIVDIVKNDDINYRKKELFDILGEGDFESFDIAFRSLLNQGEIVFTSKKKVVLPEVLGLYTGQMDVKRKGFGFLRMPDDDIFVSKSDLNGAMNNDTVMVKQTKRADTGRTREGEVIKIFETEPRTIIGTFERNKAFSFILPDEPGMDDVFISKAHTLKARDGQKVLVQITKRAKDEKKPEGKVTEILGYPGDKGVDVLSVIKRFGIKVDFEPEAIRQAEASARSRIEKKEIKERKDLRKDVIFTIDGADAKDLDDAVSIKKLKNGNFLLGVHIADVTHYVKKNSALDNEAYVRATSVYLVDKVVPMLPACLSNGVCSLNEKVDRLTLSCEMEIDKSGKLVSHSINKSIINSVHRMTYSDVNSILEDKDKKLIAEYKDIYKSLIMMQGLAKTLRIRREEKGSIDFDIEEAHIKVDDKGRVVEIVPRERGTAEKLIEEFMLMANKTVAEDFFWRELPFVYRVHEKPESDKFVELSYFLSNFGFRLKGINGDIHPKMLQQILLKIKGEQHENIISKVLLRSLKKAEYNPENLGHFGLAFEHYCHFTSPIRRYPDFTIHRIIKDTIDGKIKPDDMNALEDEAGDVSKQSSLMERRAMEAERAVEDIKKCEFMKDKVGEKFIGVVSGVMNSAIFVELDNTIEGVIPLSSLTDDYYNYIDKMFCIVGERTKKKINLGDEIKVVLKDVNVRQTRIEFDIDND
jgi:ribonuclease R